MKPIGAIPAVMLGFLVSSPGSWAQGSRLISLDFALVELKEAGSLSKLCKSNNNIKECFYAVGEWKPTQLERAKMQAHSCFDRCGLDVFGFYKDTETSREVPAVRTKDFDPSAPSRGFEAIFYPVALRVFRYEGCARCSLIYQYPSKVTAKVGAQSYDLPILARGGYYIPSALRRALVQNPSTPLTLDALTTEGSYVVNISQKTITEYVKMLTLLKYDEVL